MLFYLLGNLGEATDLSYVGTGGLTATIGHAQHIPSMVLV